MHGFDVHRPENHTLVASRQVPPYRDLPDSVETRQFRMVRYHFSLIILWARVSRDLSMGLPLGKNITYTTRNTGKGSGRFLLTPQESKNWTSISLWSSPRLVMPRPTPNLFTIFSRMLKYQKIKSFAGQTYEWHPSLNLVHQAWRLFYGLTVATSWRPQHG